MKLQQQLEELKTLMSVSKESTTWWKELTDAKLELFISG